MIHLVALIKISDKKVAYHYATDDIDTFFEKKSELGNIPPKLLSLISTHVIKTTSKDFESIQEMDPYFENTTEIESLKNFVEFLQEEAELTSVDVASYIEQKYRLGSFLLQKILYYVYAEMLVSFEQIPFKANFLAYERGPVDNDVYRINKYDSDCLSTSINFDQKIFNVEDGDKYVGFIDEVVKTYRHRFTGAWDDESKNLTHKPGTPWSRAHERGYNEPIRDEDIIKYHHLETV